MVMDFYGRMNDDFSGKPESVYCSKNIMYTDQGDYIQSDEVVKRIMALIHEKIPSN